jgi:hypothetical protein
VIAELSDRRRVQASSFATLGILCPDRQHMSQRSFHGPTRDP